MRVTLVACGKRVDVTLANGCLVFEDGRGEILDHTSAYRVHHEVAAVYPKESALVRCPFDLELEDGEVLRHCVIDRRGETMGFRYAG